MCQYGLKEAGVKRTEYEKRENWRKEENCGIGVGDGILLAVVLGTIAVGIRWFATPGTLKLRDLHFRRINTEWFPVLIKRVFVARVFTNSGSCESRKLETRKPQCLPVECQGARTTSSGAQCCDKRIGERALPFL